MYLNQDIDYLKFFEQKKLYIFGCGQQGISSMHQLKKRGYAVIAFVDNAAEKWAGIVEGLKVISFQELEAMNRPEEHMIVICSNREKEIREQLLYHNIYNFVGINQVDFGGGAEYYDEAYLEYQEEIGKFGAKLKKPLFEKYLLPDSAVLDFGCGSGELLQLLDVTGKAGIEINDFAREKVKNKGITCYKYAREVPDGTFDFIISSSALEHVENPFNEIKMLRNKLKAGGKAIFYVPNESCETEYFRNDVNNHLYTWNCLNLGNLFKAAGYYIHLVERIQEVWPEHYFQIKEEVSPEFFDTICKMNGKLWDENRCLIIAYK